MNLPDVPLFAMLRTRMSWLNQRQDVLSQNVANADTPGYVAHDIKPLDFQAILRGESAGSSGMTTDARHIGFAGEGFSQSPQVQEYAASDGNAVSLEQEMIKVSETQAQFQAAANLYSKAMNMMRTAIGH